MEPNLGTKIVGKSIGDLIFYIFLIMLTLFQAIKTYDIKKMSNIDE